MAAKASIRAVLEGAGWPRASAPLLILHVVCRLVRRFLSKKAANDVERAVNSRGYARGRDQRPVVMKPGARLDNGLWRQASKLLDRQVMGGHPQAVQEADLGQHERAGADAHGELRLP